MEALGPQWLTSKVKQVVEHHKHFEVLLLASPLRYAVDEKKLALQAALLNAKELGQEVRVLIDPEQGLILDYDPYAAL